MPTVKTDSKPTVRKKVRDAQTGKEFDVIDEGWIDIFCAWISAAYSLAVIGFLSWLVLNMRYGQPTMAALQSLAKILSGPTSKLIFYTAVGGAIGASVNNLRSFIAWHAEERAFGWRFVWKYLAMPPIGGTLAMLVYGILQGGAAVMTGATAPATGQATAVSALSAWATGALAGYGSHNVFKWLDDKVNSLFKIDAQQTTIPDVKGKLLEEARQALKDAQLKVGDITEAPATGDQVGKVIAQTPEAGNKVDCSSKVDLTVGIAGPTDPTPIPENGQPKVEEPIAPDSKTVDTTHG
jgi:PASTA domain-containing protein